MSAAWYSEKLLIDRLGISADAILQFRQSQKKTDVKKSGRAIFISEAAVKKLLEDLGSPQRDVANCALQENGETPPPQILELTVYRIFPNPRLILATRDDNGDIVRVMVPNNVNFQPRMKIKARPPHKTEGPQLYRLEGRCPRYRGRW